MTERVRFAVVGTGRRSEEIYCPLLGSLKDEVEFVGVWGRSEPRARALGEKFRVPWFADLEQMRVQAQPHAAIVSVNYWANGEIGRRVVELGLHALLETPIAHDLADADAIIAAAETRGVQIEVAEQYYRRPIERLKHALIEAGVFGRVNVAVNDFMGHGYHGVSLIRSYLGFDNSIAAVNGFTAKYSAAPHYAWIERKFISRDEDWEHGVLQFADGRLGFFNWSSLAYDSALRWERSTRFFAEKGMGIGDRLTLLTSDGKDPQPIEIERRFHNVGGMETLSELIAHTQPEIAWRNPFRAYFLDDEIIAVADAVIGLVHAIRDNHPPEYGAAQARLDQAVVLALHESASRGGESVRLTG